VGIFALGQGAEGGETRFCEEGGGATFATREAVEKPAGAILPTVEESIRCRKSPGCGWSLGGGSWTGFGKIVAEWLRSNMHTMRSERPF